MPQQPAKPLPHDPKSPYVLVPLHQFPEFTFPCATLLNMEWPRSRQSRSPNSPLVQRALQEEQDARINAWLNSLWSCSKNFPVAMVLVRSHLRQAVGFCKVSLIPNLQHACFVESVVVHPDLRGKGLGSLLMKKLEDYVVSRKLSTVYLSTLGQEKFYKRLGYNECEPVSLYAFGLGSNSSSQCTNGNKESENCKAETTNVHDALHKTSNHNDSLKKHNIVLNGSPYSNSKNSVSEKSSVPPPPPPPLPKTSLGEGVMTAKTYMKKDLQKV